MAGGAIPMGVKWGPQIWSAEPLRHHPEMLMRLEMLQIMMAAKMRSFITRAMTAAAAVMVLGMGDLAHAADVTPFFAGKTLRVLVGFSPGGGYDLYARELARYMGRYVPGHPTVVV